MLDLARPVRRAGVTRWCNWQHKGFWFPRSRFESLPGSLDWSVAPKHLARWGKRVPSIDKIGPYQFFLYSSDGCEPLHIHVHRERATAKFWLDPVRLAQSRSFSDHELRSLQKIVEESRARVLEAWNEHFGH